MLEVIELLELAFVKLNHKNNAMKKLRCSLRWLLLTAPLLFASVLMADETEIYFADKSGTVAPNVLFVIDASGSMKQVVSGDASGRTRLQVLKDSFQEVMNTAPSNLNVGLMHYANHGLGNDYWWSSIKGTNFPISPIDGEVPALGDDNLPDPAAGTVVREFLADIVHDWEANGYTPIVDSLYEAARYFRGDTVEWGMDVPTIGWAAHPLTYDNAPTCSASHTEPCVKSWGQCNTNIVEGSCASTSHNQCCEWIPTGGDGSGSCKNDDYTCSTVIEKCQHTICDTVEGDPTYKSPIQYSCQANYLVLMSDGKPEYPYFPGLGDTDGTHYYPPSVKDLAIGDFKPMPNPDWATYFTDLITASNSQIKVAPRLQDYLGTTGANGCDGTAAAPQDYNSGRCGPELTRWLADTDHNTTLKGKQGVETYTVAFALGDEPKGTAYLKDLATKEDGAFTADNAEELAGAFKAILNSISKASSSFSSPTYAIDTNNMLAHSDEVYIPMFDRSTTAMWSGNLKKFTRTVDGQIVGEGGAAVVNDKGEFLETADDVWGPISGSDVTSGGAASQLPAPSDRNLYTDVSTDADLTATTNALISSNAKITDGMLVGLSDIAGGPVKYWLPDADGDGTSCLGYYDDCTGKKHIVLGDYETKEGCVEIASVAITCPASDYLTDSQREALLDFARGENPDGTARQHMGDMLNSKPLVVDYGDGEERIFAATNEGFLHSIDTGDGEEQWAFMPKGLLPNIKTFMENLPTKDHVYGIDGPLTLWNYDKNSDGDIADVGDKRVLFFGLRRGGNAYYALDITEPDSPVILWKKENNLDVDEGVLDSLGETWSKPTLAKMRVGSSTSNEIRNVVVFGAGYDPNKDVETVSERPADTLGRDVMVVDALDGTIHWSLQRDLYNNVAANNPVKHSIPGDIRVMDMDRNGALDRLYFSDTGGNVWRVDMDHDLRDSDPDMYNYDDAILTKIADLGTNGDYGTDTRKFFYEPDIALIQDNGKVHMTISLGSGYRSHPLNTNTEDRFYVLMDPNVYNEPPAGFVALKNTDLTNARTGFTDPNDNLLNGNHKGWYYDFSDSGEKVLAPAVTFLNKVVFTTFAPVDEDGQGPSPDPCEVPPNSARAYVLDLFTGKAVANLDRDTGGSKDEFVVAGFNEILDAAKIIFRLPSAADGGTCVEGDCQQTVEIRVGKLEMPILDASNDEQGTGVGGVTGSVDLTDILPRMFWLDHNVTD
ncbi:von Willebrand factor type A domain-containing protein [Thiothrix caldifontis]|uniref:von Willebrand factor type A domain-containing protein n=2 Tax=Thiothrix caldifontis TaxID=525918 RepID=A0A1H4CSU5_9GAMM|nr:von Willebrand factor type A domain-containing protein [Thiothrix caldifontis]